MNKYALGLAVLDSPVGHREVQSTEPRSTTYPHIIDFLLAPLF
jgi:hypothetical protein